MNDALLEELKNTYHWYHRVNLGKEGFTVDENQPSTKIEWKSLESHRPKEPKGLKKYN